MHITQSNLKQLALTISVLYVEDPEALATLCLYKSPNNESSIAKGIPATPAMLDTMKKVSKVMPISIKYRGSRRPGPIGQATCLKKDATSFAIYLR